MSRHYLDEFRPKSILELGLGQSSKLIGQYVRSAKYDTEHYIVEHDKTWIDSFNRTYKFDGKSKLVRLDLRETRYDINDKINANVLRYEGFRDQFSDKKIDFISVDGPFGTDGDYSRIDILEILPDCLMDSFCILFDDYERIGEKNTVEIVKKCLDKAGIRYASGIYQGLKNVGVITSENLKFFTTM